MPVCSITKGRVEGLFVLVVPGSVKGKALSLQGGSINGIEFIVSAGTPCAVPATGPFAQVIPKRGGFVKVKGRCHSCLPRTTAMVNGHPRCTVKSGLLEEFLAEKLTMPVFPLLPVEQKPWNPIDEIFGKNAVVHRPKSMPNVLVLGKNVTHIRMSRRGIANGRSQGTVVHITQNKLIFPWSEMRKRAQQLNIGVQVKAAFLEQTLKPDNICQNPHFFSRSALRPNSYPETSILSSLCKWISKSGLSSRQ